MTLGNDGNQQGTQVSIGIVFVLFGRRIIVGGKPMGLGPVFFHFHRVERNKAAIFYLYATN